MDYALQSTVPLQDAGHAGINLGRSRRVYGERMGPEFVSQRLEPLGVPRGDDQPRPPRDELATQGGADPTRGAEHEVRRGLLEISRGHAFGLQVVDQRRKSDPATGPGPRSGSSSARMRRARS